MGKPANMTMFLAFSKAGAAIFCAFRKRGVSETTEIYCLYLHFFDKSVLSETQTTTSCSVVFWAGTSGKNTKGKLYTMPCHAKMERPLLPYRYNDVPISYLCLLLLGSPTILGFARSMLCNRPLRERTYFPRMSEKNRCLD